MRTRIVCLLIGLVLIASVAPTTAEDEKKPDPGYQEAADRAEAMLEAARERLLELRDGIPPRRKNPLLDLNAVGFNDAGARAEALVAAYRKTHDPALAAMQPGAYTVLGRYHLALAGDHEGKEKQVEARQAYADARWNYIQVVVQYRERQEYQEEATYFVGFCYDKLKDEEPGGRERAIRYWLDVVRRFPNGTFAKRATQDLERIGYRRGE